jgi:N-acetylglutamate synthase
MPNLSDMEIGRNRVPIRKDKTDVFDGMQTKVFLEGANVHAIVGIFLYGYLQAETEFCPLTPLDYDQALALWRRCNGIEVAEGNDRESFTCYLERNPGLSHAATQAGAIVGATLCGHDGRRGLVYHLAVSPEHRGQGLGRKILELGLSGLSNCGITRVIILVGKDNAQGQEFWISQGFDHIADALPLRLDLTGPS